MPRKRRKWLEDGNIYFVTDGEAIKIGYTTCLEKRLKGLQTSQHWPLFLIGSVRGNRNDERNFHERLHKVRINGEWFKTHDDVYELMEELRKRGLWIEGEQMEDYKLRVKGLDA